MALASCSVRVGGLITVPWSSHALVGHLNVARMSWLCCEDITLPDHPATSSNSLIVSSRVLPRADGGKLTELSSVRPDCGWKDLADISDTVDGYQPCLISSVLQGWRQEMFVIVMWLTCWTASSIHISSKKNPAFPPKIGCVLTGCSFPIIKDTRHLWPL